MSFSFLADENIHEEVIAFLNNQNCDTISVHALQLNAKPDKEILQMAFQLDRIILTHDSDFGQIIFTEKVPFKGLIYLQPGHIQSQHTIDTLKAVLSSDIDLKQPFILVADNKQGMIKIRVRNEVIVI